MQRLGPTQQLRLVARLGGGAREQEGCHQQRGARPTSAQEQTQLRPAFFAL
jgi:hypothetical protein